jgi:hypothetical protein
VALPGECVQVVSSDTAVPCQHTQQVLCSKVLVSAGWLVHWCRVAGTLVHPRAALTELAVNVVRPATAPLALAGLPGVCVLKVYSKQMYQRYSLAWHAMFA